MGQGESSRHRGSEVDILRHTTYFSHGEILEWHHRFYNDCPQGYLTKRSFVAMYVRMFPEGDPRNMAEHVFNAQDTNHDGRVDFVEFMNTLSVVKRGSVEEKLHWAFRLYDLNGDGRITREEAVKILVAIFKMRGHKNYESRAAEAVEHLFLHLDKDQDNTLSHMEFIVGGKQSRPIVRLLKSI